MCWRSRQIGGGAMSHVLVVDDDVGIREMLRCALEVGGYAVHKASDGVMALDAMRASVEPLVVLLDLNMPRLTGEGVLAAMAHDRALAERHACILMTADAGCLSTACVSLLSALGVPLLSKPFDLDALLEMVGEAARRNLYPHDTLAMPTALAG
jgi:CheY-like chemotaxis protein